MRGGRFLGAVFCTRGRARAKDRATRRRGWIRTSRRRGLGSRISNGAHYSYTRDDRRTRVSVDINRLVFLFLYFYFFFYRLCKISVRRNCFRLIVFRRYITRTSSRHRVPPTDSRKTARFYAGKRFVFHSFVFVTKTPV